MYQMVGKELYIEVKDGPGAFVDCTWFVLKCREAPGDGIMANSSAL